MAVSRAHGRQRRLRPESQKPDDERLHRETRPGGRNPGIQARFPISEGVGEREKGSGEKKSTFCDRRVVVNRGGGRGWPPEKLPQSTRHRSPLSPRTPSPSLTLFGTRPTLQHTPSLLGARPPGSRSPRELYPTARRAPTASRSLPAPATMYGGHKNSAGEKVLVGSSTKGARLAQLGFAVVGCCFALGGRRLQCRRG